MARTFVTPIDLSGLEILNVRAQQLSADPSTSSGKFYYNTTDNVLKFYNGTAWITIGRLDQISAPTASVAMNTQKLTGLAAGTGAGDSVRYEQAILASGANAFAADQSMGGFKLTNVATPVSGTDAANKDYVDLAITGLDFKDSVRVKTTGSNITLSGGAPNTLDGVTLAANDRILVTDQSTGSQNGIYYVSTLGTGANGTWTRATDADANGELDPNAFVFVEEGTQYGDSGWVMTANSPFTLGTTAQTWVQFTGTGQITAGAGLTKTGNTIDIVAADGSITVNADSITVGLVPVSKGGTGATTLTLRGVLFGNGTSAIGATAAGTTGQVLKAVTGGSPIFGAVSLTADVTGVLPIANGGTNASSAAAARTSLVAAGFFNQTIGDGVASSFNIDHNLGTLDCIVQCYRVSDGVQVEPDITRSTTNRVIVAFATVPTSNQYRVMVHGGV